MQYSDKMEESQKPFACTIQGCEMTFANEDHLNWHQKKHDMMLNLSLANKNAEVADQTPTPTRFIRNCEEVGLFQDLQNVNPFDETFKKAIESSKSGTLHVPNANANEDSLHTPHIFPIVGDTVPVTRSDSRSIVFSITSVPSSPRIENKDKSKVVTDLKSKLKESIQNKGKNTSPQTTTLIVTPATIGSLDPNSKKAESNQDSSSDKNQKSSSDYKAKVREINRVAQLRCRKRKQIQWKKMEEDIRHLKSDNSKLSHENQCMKHQLYLIKELIINHKKDCSNSFLEAMEQIMSRSMQLPRQINDKVLMPKSNADKRITASLIPVSMVQNPGQKPVLIQVMGSVSQLAVSVLPSK